MSFAPPPRLLLGSGPSPVPQRVLDALAQPTVGHLDPSFVELMEETADLLRAAFRTENAATLPVSATGSGGMDALIANFVEPGDRVVVGVNGLFGERLTDALGRAGAEAVRVEADWGRALDLADLAAAVDDGRRRRLRRARRDVDRACASRSTGLGERCREAGALLLVDCVTTLSGQPVLLDEWGVDAAFSGTQKCLNAPPGLAPVHRGRARAGEAARTQVAAAVVVLRPVARARLLGGRGWARVPPHRADQHDLRARRGAADRRRGGARGRAGSGTGARTRRCAARSSQLGLERLARDGEELWPLLAVKVPDGVDDAAVRGALLTEHGIEIAGALGPLAGKVWRVGVMGEGARPEPQERLVRALAELLRRDPAPAVEALEAGWATAAAWP